MSSMRPTKNRNVLQATITQVCELCGRNKRYVTATESQMLRPPSIAVGFLCQRSVFGFATTPIRRASARMRGVSATASPNATAGGTNPETFSGNIENRPSELVRSYSIARPKASHNSLAFAWLVGSLFNHWRLSSPLDDSHLSWRDWVRLLGPKSAAQLRGERGGAPALDLRYR